jgi:hypothetical protein
MSVVRTEHTATLLASGKVLITGGVDTLGRLASAELYDPDTGSFSATGSLLNDLVDQTATLLADGKVLLAGGLSVDNPLPPAELYTP